MAENSSHPPVCSNSKKASPNYDMRGCVIARRESSNHIYLVSWIVMTTCMGLIRSANAAVSCMCRKPHHLQVTRGCDSEDLVA